MPEFVVCQIPIRAIGYCGMPGLLKNLISSNWPTLPIRK